MQFGALLVYGILGLTVVASAIGLITSRNAIYSALFLVVNFLAVGLLYLALGVPFIAFAQVTVYAGSIMVLFLFVIMLLGAEQLPFQEPLRGQRVLGVLLAVIFLAELALYYMLRTTPLNTLPVIPESITGPAQIGMLLFNKYMLPFQLTAVILLASTVGAILLSKQEGAPRPKPGAQKSPTSAEE
ncbi:MAG: NADH-quinone oxidoreductase subunit J [Chloroflexota bacterium]|jgi:NADH-quinone oxidoreductase subunit J